MSVCTIDIVPRRGGRKKVRYTVSLLLLHPLCRRRRRSNACDYYYYLCVTIFGYVFFFIQ